MSLPQFSDDVWAGGLFELALEVGDRSTHQLNAAIGALWQHPELIGCFELCDVDPAAQTRRPPELCVDEEWGPSNYGVALMPNGIRIPCTSLVVRETDGPDWLYLSLPMASLALAYDVGGYPIDPGQPTDWLPEVEAWLAKVGIWLSERCNFRLGLIGWEVVCFDGTTADELLQRGGVPERRSIGYLWPLSGTCSYLASNIG